MLRLPDGGMGTTCTAMRKCMVCDGPGRIPWHGFRRMGDPPPPPLLEVSGCHCRLVCAACYAAVGGFLERAPCLLCGLACGAPGCSPLVRPGQPRAPGEEAGTPQLQWLRPLASVACGAAVHAYANVASGVGGGFGPWPSRPPPLVLSSEGESSSEDESSTVSEASSDSSDDAASSGSSAPGGLG